MVNRLQRNQQQSWRWRDCQEDPAALWRSEEPREPNLGQGWFDPRSNSLNIWNGSEWVCVPAD